MTTVDLFGNPEPDPFLSAKERYGIWPTTVWACDMADATTRRLKALIGDDGSAREGVFTKATDDRSVYRGKVTESIFNPAVAAWLLNCYAPSSGVCLDPFAGGGTRAIMAAKHGLRYVGTELRRAECAAVRERCERAGVDHSVEIIEGDARHLAAYIGKSVGDFLLTCPPYHDLEVYGGGPADLSMCADYDAFCAALGEVVTATRDALKPGAKSCWVIGMTRDRTGELLPLHHAIARAHASVGGFRFKEEIVLHVQNTGAIQRIGQFDKGDRRLVRVHEYALVFVREGATNVQRDPISGTANAS